MSNVAPCFFRTRSPPRSKAASERKKSKSNKPSRSNRRITDAALATTHKENEEMLRRLARKRRGQPRLSESDKNITLARLAGLEIPEGTLGLPNKARADAKPGRRQNRGPRSPKKVATRSDRGRNRTPSPVRSRRKSGSSEERRNRDRNRLRSAAAAAPEPRDHKHRSNRDRNPTLERFSPARKSPESHRRSPPRRDRDRDRDRRRKRSREHVTGLESEATKSRRSKLLMSRSRSRSRSQLSPKKKEGNGNGSPGEPKKSL